MSTISPAGIIIGIVITATSSIYMMIYHPVGIDQMVSLAGVIVGAAMTVACMPTGSPI